MYVLAAHPLCWMQGDADGSHQYAKCVIRMTPSTDRLRISDEFHHGILAAKMR